MKKFVFILGMLLANQLCLAAISLPAIFSDHMVLQRNQDIPVWGWANPGEKISLHFHEQAMQTVANAKGEWMIRLKPEAAGGPYSLIVEGSNKLAFQDVLVGDVWFCSGQSNMEWDMVRTEGYDIEMQQASFPPIRQIKILKAVNTLPQQQLVPTAWKITDTNTLKDVSGVAYYFAKKMQAAQQVPIGIINDSWGGTNIETWIPREAFEASPYFSNMIKKMPRIAGDSFRNYLHEQQTKQIEKQLKARIADFNERDFMRDSYNESAAADISCPKGWEAQGYDLDGIGWYRKTVELSEADLQSDAHIFLGMIDDDDITYVNGVKVGETHQYDARRIYTIPKALLKAGKNVIVVRVTDTGGGGGLWGEDDLKIETSGRKISLTGAWKFYVSEIFRSFRENDYPSLVYNGMVAPLVPYAISGFLWYQGESNAGRAWEYRQSFPLLIDSWRRQFGKDLPFYFVQLATFNTPGNSNEGCAWAELREAQTQTLSVKNTGMAVTTDVGNPTDIHPRNKKAVGERLANLALKNGLQSPVYSSSNVMGKNMLIRFTPTITLTTTRNNPVIGFEMAGPDGYFYPAKAIINKNVVVVSCDRVDSPVAVRYGWKGDDSAINLISTDGLPVSPFRTDNRDAVTKGNSYQFSIE